MGAPKGCKQHGSVCGRRPWLALDSLFRSPLHKQAEKTVLSPVFAPISDSEGIFPVWMSGHQLRAVTIGSSLMGGCGLSHGCVEMAARTLV